MSSCLPKWLTTSEPGQSWSRLTVPAAIASSFSSSLTYSSSNSCYVQSESLNDNSDFSSSDNLDAADDRVTVSLSHACKPLVPCKATYYQEGALSGAPAADDQTFQQDLLVPCEATSYQQALQLVCQQRQKVPVQQMAVQLFAAPRVAKVARVVVPIGSALLVKPYIVGATPAVQSGDDQCAQQVVVGAERSSIPSTAHVQIGFLRGKRRVRIRVPSMTAAHMSIRRIGRKLEVRVANSRMHVRVGMMRKTRGIKTLH